MEPDAVEIRVIGCLIEKQRTTPDVYPLTLNSLRLACNQSTNRDPVVDYDDGTVRAGLDRLVQRKWTTLASWANRRTMKYRHTLDRALGLDDAEISLLCVLMLRGPQTPGELRARSERLHRFADAAELEQTLERLIGRELIERLDAAAGAARGALSAATWEWGGGRRGAARRRPAPAVAPSVPATPPPRSPRPPRTTSPSAWKRLERELAELREGLAALRRELGS